MAKTSFTSPADAAAAPTLPGQEPLLEAIASSRIYDWLLRGSIALFFLYFAYLHLQEFLYRLVHFDSGAPSAVVLTDIGNMLARLCSFSFFALVTLITLIRAQPVAKAPGVLPRIAAILGNILVIGIGYLHRLPDPPIWLLFLSAGITLLGNVLTVLVLTRLGKSFSVMSEARRLVTDGPYRVVRHPLYLCEEIGIIGVFLPYWSLAMIVLLVVHFAIQLSRMAFEERVLTEAFPEYAVYAVRTKRLIPGIW